MCERRRESTYLRDRPRRHLEVSIHGGATFRSYSPSGGPASLHETRPSPPVSTSQSHRSDTHRQDKTVGVTGTYATPGRHELSSSIAQAPVPMQAPDGASTKRPASDTGHTTFAASSWDCASAASAAAVSAIPSRPDDVDVQWHAIRPPRASAVVWRPLRASWAGHDSIGQLRESARLVETGPHDIGSTTTGLCLKGPIPEP